MREFIVPDIVLFVNGIPLAVVECKKGSRKSLTMVFVARMQRASLDLNDFKIVLVIDRQNLEEQLGETATLISGRVNVIRSTLCAVQPPEQVKAHLSP